MKSFKKVVRPTVGLKILQFFEDQSDNFPTWAAVVEDIMALAPSSAPVERVFSVLRNKFDKNSMNALIDYVCASLMLKANGREILP